MDMGGIDVRGASGELDYDPVTEETTAPVEVWGIVNVAGSFEIGPPPP